MYYERDIYNRDAHRYKADFCLVLQTLEYHMQIMSVDSSMHMEWINQ